MFYGVIDLMGLGIIVSSWPSTFATGTVFSHPASVRGPCVTCGAEPRIYRYLPFSFLPLLKGLMGPEGKEGPPGLQGLRVSMLASLPDASAPTEDMPAS